MKRRPLTTLLMVIGLTIPPWSAESQVADRNEDDYAALCVGPPSQLIGWWPLDETSGNTALDLIAGNHGTLFGGPLAEVAVVGNGLTFDGLDDYVEIADDRLLRFGTGDLSFTGWIRAQASPGVRTLLDKRHFDTGFISGYHIYLFNGRLGIQLADGGFTNYISDAFVADGLFHHVAITVERTPSLVGGIAFYVDGVNVDSADPSDRTGSIANAAPLRMGARSGFPSGFWDGVIDEVELFSRVLDPSEVADIANAGHAGKCKCAKLPCQPVAWWTFDGDQHDLAVDVADHFSGPHHGRIEGPTRVFGKVGSALLLDGVDDSVVVENTAAFDIDPKQSGELTVKAWVRTSERSGPLIVRNHPGPTDLPAGWAFSLEDGLPSFYIATVEPFGMSGFAGGICSAPACRDLNLADDRWHLLGATVTYDEAGENVIVRLYVDGQRVQTFDSVDLQGDIGGGTLLIGAEILRLSRFFRGKIDEAQIFAHALGEAEFASIYAAGAAGECRPANPPQVCGVPDAENCPAGHFCDYLRASECGALLIGGLCRPKPGACPLHEEPVCGCDGVTYSNSCFASLSGISVASDGPCG